MPIDASIPLQVKLPEIENPQNALMRALQMQNAQREYDMGTMKMEDYRRGVDRQNRLEQLLQTNPDAGALLRGGFLKESLDMEEKQAKAGKERADADKVRSELIDASLKRSRQFLDSVQTPEQFLAWHQANHKDPVLGPVLAARGITPEQSMATIQQALQKPGGFQELLQKSALGLDKFMEAQRAEQQLAETGRHNRASEGIQAGQLGETRRHNTQMEGLRSSEVSQGKTPAGYRQLPNGDLQAIPGGPADLKLQGALNQDTSTLNSSTAAMDRLATAANELKNAPGLKGITGLRGAVPNIPGSEAANAQALLNTLKSQVAFGVLQDMRNNSKTGGALGSVSDAEGKRLEANLAALENAQSYEQMAASLQKIIDYTDGAKDRLRDAYNIRHNGKAGPAATASNPPAPAATASNPPAPAANGLPPMSAIEAELARRQRKQ